MTTDKSKQPLLGIIIMGLLLILSACGSSAAEDAAGIANDKATMEAMATAIAEEKQEPPATDTPLPTAPPPTATPLPPTETPLPKKSDGDSLVIAKPTTTPAPEGVILFFSSRDHSRLSETSSAIYLELYAMRPDGSQQTRLSDGTLSLYNFPPTDMVPYAVDGQIVLHDHIVFDLRTRQIEEELDTSQTIDGLPLVFARGSSSGNPLFYAIDPVWSSKNEIVFMGSKIDSSASSIYHLKSMESDPIRLTTPPENEVGDFSPSWSFDGNQLLFSRRWHDANQDGLWVTHKDGSEMRRIVVPMDTVVGIEQSAWSPDGQTIVYQDLKENKAYEGNFAFDFWTYDVNSQQTRRLTSLTSERENVWDPTWSPDSRKIAFTIAPVGEGDGVGQIYTIDAAGGEPRQLTSVGYANIMPLWLPLDADEILADGDTPLQPTPTPTSRPQPQQPQPAKATNCPSPGVEISSPAAGSRFIQQNNFIVGTANIARFHHWRMEYSTDPNGGWNYLLERDYPVDNDKLVMIDAGTIPNGPYGLRLTVVDETGNYPEPCEVWFTNGY